MKIRNKSKAGKETRRLVQAIEKATDESKASGSQNAASETGKGSANSNESPKGSPSGRGSESGEQSSRIESIGRRKPGGRWQRVRRKTQAVFVGAEGRQDSGGEGSSKKGSGKPSSSPGSKPGEGGGEQGSESPDKPSSGGEQSGKSPGKSTQSSKSGQGSKGGQPNSSGVQDSRGGGGGQGAASAKGESAPDDSKESPHATESGDSGKGLVAPEGGQQSELSLKKIQDVLNDPAALKDLEQRDGVSRSDIQQFAKQFEKKPSAPAGPGREIKVKPGEQTAAKPTPDLPGLGNSMKFSTEDANPAREHAAGSGFE